MKLFDSSYKPDISKEPMFLGKGRNVQRYDIMKYPTLYTFGQKMDGNFWKPNEVNLDGDAADFKNLERHEEHIFTENLKRQITWDSMQGHSPIILFGRISTIPELEYFLSRLGFQETNHSDTYSHILRNVYPNPGEIFDSILEGEILKRHTEGTNKYYEELNTWINRWDMGLLTEDQMFDFKCAIYKALIAWNILEGIRFYVSFACTFAFAENKKMEGNAKELKLIARDENVHLAGTQFIINALRRSESEGFIEVVDACEDEVIEMYRQACADETEWAEHLFKDGSIIGLNTEILTRYMKFITNQRAKAIGLPKMFDDITSNPLPWMNSWLGAGKTEVLPQETEVTDYAIGILEDDMSDEDWEDL